MNGYRNIRNATRQVISTQEEIATLVLTTLLGRPISPSAALLVELGYSLEKPIDPVDVCVRMAELCGFSE